MDAMQALEGFKNSGSTKTAKRFKPTPALKFDKKGGEYVIGLFTRLKALNGSKAGKGIVDVELIDTNATFTIQGENDEYKPTPVKKGDKVSLFAPTDLFNRLENIPTGVEVYIRNDGKVKEVRDGKATESYKFDVRHK